LGRGDDASPLPAAVDGRASDIAKLPDLLRKD
jgi:hypothetical protein